MTAEGEPANLAMRFRRLIRHHGSIPVARYMGESNARYYASRDPLGAAGDFVTAPEISQMFGELVGSWLADIWSRAGSPAEAIYVELGPGRGTLAKDALRAMAAHGFEPKVHFIEGSPALRAIQSDALTEAVFHDSLETLPPNRPLLLVANEFLDALPIRQLIRTDAGWRERLVDLDGEQFVFAAGPQPMDAAVPTEARNLPAGTILETCPAAAAIVGEIARRIAEQGGAALLIDYGHLTPRTGSTLQAVRGHEKIDVFAAPGKADLTAHVDFVTLARIAAESGARYAMTTQGELLTALGINERAKALAARSAEHADEIAAARDRLTAPGQMGELFKVMALVAPDWPEPAGFGPN